MRGGKSPVLLLGSRTGVELGWYEKRAGRIVCRDDEAEIGGKKYDE